MTTLCIAGCRCRIGNDAERVILIDGEVEICIVNGRRDDSKPLSIIGDTCSEKSSREQYLGFAVKRWLWTIVAGSTDDNDAIVAFCDNA
jgi:hypothetical protein